MHHLQWLSLPVTKPEFAMQYYEKLVSLNVNADICLFPEFSHAFILFNYSHENKDALRMLEDIHKRLEQKGF
jgi:hypothetical protein